MNRSPGRWRLAAFALWCTALSAMAHPIGMQSVDHYSRLEIERDRIRVIYDLDMAEIATVLDFKRVDTNGDGEASEEEKTAFAAVRARELAEGLRLEVNGQRLALTPSSAKVFIRAGENNLPTLRLITPLETAPGALAGALRGNGAQAGAYRDDNEADRAGWRQIGLAAPAGQILDRAIGGQAAMAGPEDYVIDAKGDKTNVREVEFHFRLGSPAPPPKALVTAQKPRDAGRGRMAAGFAALVIAVMAGLWLLLKGRNGSPSGRWTAASMPAAPLPACAPVVSARHPCRPTPRPLI